jgi:PTH1 family peptidyl-tRNA hydrolase
MLLVVGLGNPGREHEKDRHNVGFVVVDALRSAWNLPDYRSKFHALWTRGEVGGRPVALLEPQTYMNLSGDAVQPAAAFLKVDPSDILVVHDELDLPWKDLRLKMGGGHAGHNGVRSIIDRLGTPDFARLRVGIGKPAPSLVENVVPSGERPGHGSTRSWVLSAVGAVERAEKPPVVSRAVGAVRGVLEEGLVRAMKALHTKAR